jgi:hypothetical protein
MPIGPVIRLPFWCHCSHYAITHKPASSALIGESIGVHLIGERINVYNPSTRFRYGLDLLHNVGTRTSKP